MRHKHLRLSIALVAASAFSTFTAAQPAVAPPQVAGAQPGGPSGPGGPGGGPPLPPGMPPMPPQEPVVLITAAEIVDGHWLPGDKRSGAQVRGAGRARGLAITSPRDGVNGLVVRGVGRQRLQDTTIEISGGGKSDFDGIAAGVLVKDGATLELDGARIITRGVVAAAATVTDQGTLRVWRSTLVAEGGPMPSGYTRRIGPGMMEPPTPLGITGSARTTLTMGSAKAYFNDSTIVAEGWGALSTDAARGAYLEVNRCKVLVRRSGYGAYADNGASVVINDSTLDVPTFGGIIAGQASLAFKGAELRSAGNAVMIHSVMGQPGEVATLTIEGGRMQSTNAAIVVKSANADILITTAQISARNGDLLLGVVNDDSFATKVNGKAVSGIRATIAGSQLKGNLVHLDADRRMMVSLQRSTLQGRITGATLSLDATSRWLATANSSVTLEGPVLPGQLDASAGVTIRVINGTGSSLAGRQALPGGGLLLVE